MKYPVVIIFCVVLFFVKAHAQNIAASDSLEIYSKIEDWNRGWKNKDYIPAVQWYTSDAEFTNAFGHHRVGQQAIEALLKEVFQLPFVMAGDSKVVNQKMMSIAPGVVLVIKRIERAGQQTADNKQLGLRNTTHHRLFKKGNEWKIVAHLISDTRETQAARH